MSSRASRTPRSTPSHAQNYTWVNGFIDFFTFVKENLLFTITFIVFHSFIGYTLVASYNKRMGPIQNEICPKLVNDQTYFNGFEWIPKPEGNLQQIHDQVIEQVKSRRSLFVEDLQGIATTVNATIEQAEAAVELKGEYFIHYYRAVIPCQPTVQSNEGLLTVALIYLVGYAVYLVYLTSPFH